MTIKILIRVTKALAFRSKITEKIVCFIALGPGRKTDLAVCQTLLTKVTTTKLLKSFEVF